jgi:hypothetical protein
MCQLVHIQQNPLLNAIVGRYAQVATVLEGPHPIMDPAVSILGFSNKICAF